MTTQEKESDSENGSHKNALVQISRLANDLIKEHKVITQVEVNSLYS